MISRSDPEEVIRGLVTSLMYETSRGALVFEFQDLDSLEIEYISTNDVMNPETLWTDPNLNANSSIVSDDKISKSEGYFKSKVLKSVDSSDQMDKGSRLFQYIDIQHA